jgi:hypothetical protein
MSKYLKIIFIILFIAGLFWASHASAQDLVPCGRREAASPVYKIGNICVNVEAPCTLCHFFILIARIIDFVLFTLVPPLALLMLIIGGATFMLATGNPQTITTAKKIIGSVFIGLVIIYGAYFVVGLVLQSIGLTSWAHTFYQTWWSPGGFTVDCDLGPNGTIPCPPPPAGP